MIITSKIVKWFGICGITIYPFIFIAPSISKLVTDDILIHETVHYMQQRRWALYGLGIGLLFWHFLYLFALPFIYNPFRRKWETEAYRVNGWSDEFIKKNILRGYPYYLIW